MRAVSVPFSPERPSRLKNEPGILPAAYMRSSTSTVSGRKSTSRRLPTVAVLRTIVSPWRTTTAPEACLAILPVSNEISWPAISTETVVTASCHMLFPSGGAARRIGGPASFARLLGSELAVSLPRAQQRRGARDARAQPVAHVAAHPLGDRRTGGRPRSVDVEAERSQRAHRCGSSMRPWSAKSASWNAQKAPWSAAASAACASATARGWRALSAKWRKTTGCRRPQPSAVDRAARAAEVGVHDDEPAPPRRRGRGRRRAAAGRSAGQVAHARQDRTRDQPCGSTPCAASRRCPERPPRSSRSSPTRGTSRRSRRRCCASRS